MCSNPGEVTGAAYPAKHGAGIYPHLPHKWPSHEASTIGYHGSHLGYQKNPRKTWFCINCIKNPPFWEPFSCIFIPSQRRRSPSSQDDASLSSARHEHTAPRSASPAEHRTLCATVIKTWDWWVVSSHFWYPWSNHYPDAPCLVYLPTWLGDFRANGGIHVPAPWSIVVIVAI